jgi:hypothetical protein
MTFTGSLKGDFLIAVAIATAVFSLPFVNDLVPYVQIPLLIASIVGMLTCPPRRERPLIPGNIHFGVICMAIATIVSQIIFTTDDLFVGIVLAALTVFWTSAIIEAFTKLTNAFTNSVLKLGEKYQAPVRFVLFVLIYFCTSFINPVLPLVMVAILWGDLALERGNQLTGWGDTTN